LVLGSEQILFCVPNMDMRHKDSKSCTWICISNW